MNLRKFLKILPFAIAILFSTSIISACSNTNSATNQDNLKMAPMDSMPAQVQSAPVSVQQAYQYAVANPDLMKQIPCYCGCGSMGHKNNYDCYVSAVDDKGKVSFDDHALGCSICVDITQDAMRLQRQGKLVTDIRAYVDQTYAKYGPSNIP